MVDIDVFCEDVSHERFLDALVHRMAAEGAVPIDLHPRCARGGHGRVLEEFRTYQRTVQTKPGLLVVAIDANCKGWNRFKRDLEEEIDGSKFPRFVAACPDPHVERWYMADPAALKRALKVDLSPGRKKCERDFYKNLLLAGLRKAGHFVTLGGAEMAAEIVAEMNLFTASKNEPSLKHVIRALRSFFQQQASKLGNP